MQLILLVQRQTALDLLIFLVSKNKYIYLCCLRLHAIKTLYDYS